MTRRRPWACLAILSAVACGDSGPNHVGDPRPAPTGGVGQGPIRGELDVFAIDAWSGVVVAGAAVRVGTASDAAPLIGTTDGDGLATFSDPKLDGAQTVTVTAAGYAAATWIGVTGAVVTVPMTPQAPSYASARVTGTIQGWAQLPAPAPNHYLYAQVEYSRSEPIEAPQNNISQGGTNVCVRRTGYVDNCAVGAAGWSLRTRVGKLALYAVIVDVDTKGTLAAGDDTAQVVGYALRTSLTLGANDYATGQDLMMVPATSLVDASVAFSGIPAGFLYTYAAPVIQLGDQGELVLGPLYSAAPTMLSQKLPALTGDLGGGRLDLVAKSQNARDQAVPSTALVQRDVSTGSTLRLLGWLAPPIDLAALNGTYSFTRGSAQSLVAVQLAAGSRREWDVVVLDGTSAFVLPPLSPDPLAPGVTIYRVTEVETPDFDPGNFSGLSLRSQPLRVADNETTFAR